MSDRLTDGTDHWSVSVWRNGDNVVTIESNFMSGRDLIDGDAEFIRNCATNLLAFVGDAPPRPCAGCAALRAELQDAKDDAEHWLLCCDGVKHDPRCPNHCMGSEQGDPCLRCQNEKLRADTGTVQRAAWEAGFKLAVSYGDNWIHFDGEQKERQWVKFIAQSQPDGVKP